MVLKCALVLCLVSVFGFEARHVLRLSPHYTSSSEEYYRTRPFHRYHGRPYAYRGMSLESDESDEEFLQKEGGTFKPFAVTYFVSTHNLSWENARDECKSKGMVLVSPTNQEQKWDLEQYLQRNSLQPVDQYSGYWIGGKRLSADEPWIWEVDGQEVRSLGWLPGEPNGFDGEDCMEFKYDYLSGWNNYYCSALKRFICQSKPYIHETEKNDIKNPKFSHTHEETLKEKFYNPDNTKTKKSSNIETTTTAATTTTYQYPTRFPFSLVHRDNNMHVVYHSSPLFYHTEEPSSTYETSSVSPVPPSTTSNIQTDNTESTTLMSTVQTESSGPTETTFTATTVSSTEKTDASTRLEFLGNLDRVIASSRVGLSSTERSENMDESSPSSSDATVTTDEPIVFASRAPIIYEYRDPRLRHYQELEEEFLHRDFTDSIYEDYV